MKKLAILSFFWCCVTPLFSQNLSISYQNPAGLVVCGTDVFSVSLTNSGAVALPNLTATLQLPAGLVYQLGSLSGGATEQNISNLQQPVFSVGTLAGGAQQSFVVRLAADCALLQKINAGELFSIQIQTNWQGGSEKITTNNFKIETGLVLIQSITPTTFSGEAGDMFIRKVRLINTRQGRIGSLQLTDLHFPGLTMEVPGVGGSNPTPTLFDVTLPSSFFKDFGNGDEFFDFNEIIEISVKVTITDCGLPPFSNESKITVGWGCNGSVCQQSVAKAEVSILPSSKNPFLTFKTDYGLPNSYCASTPSENILTVTNTGSTNANTLIISLVSPDSSVIGFDGSSFTVDGVPFLPNLSDGGALEFCDKNYLKRVSIVVPVVPAGQTVVVKFHTYFCGETCKQPLVAFGGNYFYYKTCPPTAFDVGNLRFEPDTVGAKIRSEVNYDIGVCLEDGQIYDFTYWVSTSRLSKTTGFLTVQMNLPWGLFYDTDCVPLLDGKSPSSVEVKTTQNERTVVRLVFALPFTKDSVAGHFCIKNVCQDPSFYTPSLPNVPKRGADWTIFPVPETCNPCVHRVEVRTILSLEPNPTADCGVSACDLYQLVMNCGCNDANVCSGSNCVKGAIVTNFNTYRTNIGWRDQNDDRQADANLPADPSKIDLDRYLPRDTIHTILSAVVDNAPVSSLGFRLFHEAVMSDFGWRDSDPFKMGIPKLDFVNYDSLRYLSGTVRFVINGKNYTCPISPGERSDQHFISIVHPNVRPYIEYDQLVSMFHEFSIVPKNHAGGCLPAGTEVLNPGDSVIFECDFKFLRNVVPESPARPALMTFRSAISTPQKVYAWNFTDVVLKRSQYSGFLERWGNGVFSIKPCDNSIQTQPWFYQIRIARANMFPFEVRPLSRFLKWQHTVPTELTLQKIDLAFFKMQENISLFNPQPMPHNLQNGILNLDLTSFFEKNIDEGYEFSVDAVFDPTCLFSKPDTAISTAQLEYPKGLSVPSPTSFSQFNLLGYYANAPKLDVVPLKNEITLSSKQVEIEFNLKNLAVAAAENVWVRVVSAGNSLADIQLVKMPGGQPVPQIAGVFQLGTVGAFFDLSYQIRAKNLSCEPLQVDILYGWDCQPVTSAGVQTCGMGSASVVLRNIRPELELVVVESPTDVALCQPSPFFELEIYNANEGTTFDVNATLKLPDGLKIVSGSCQISYPTGSAWQNIVDPAALPGNVFRWDINKILPQIASTGLPGVQNAPRHSLKIRFRVLAECGFVANAQPIFGTSGLQFCGAVANTLRKPDEPIELTGIQANYKVEASISAVGGTAFSCAEEKELDIVLNFKGQPAAGDSIYILLPAGMEYVAGSFQPSTNAPSGQPKVVGSKLVWAVPSGLGGSATVRFKIKVRYTTADDCSDQAIILQTRQRASAFCPTSNANCQVFVATGESILFLNAQNPDLILKNFTPKMDANGKLTFSADLANIGNDEASRPVIHFYLDKNSNGKVDAADERVLVVQLSQNLAGGSSLTISETLNLTTADLCQLIAHLPAAENCACFDKTSPLSGWQILHAVTASCDVKPVELAIAPTAGATYGWNPSTNLSCNNCPKTTFTPDANVRPSDRFTFILTENLPSCKVEHNFSVQFGGNLGIETPDQRVCRGNSVTLAATPGGTYQWSGPGITQPNAPSQVLTPTANATYFVTVTFAEGCTGTDAVQVEVIDKNERDLGEFNICQGKTFKMFGETFDKAGEHCKIFKNQNGCDSTVCFRLKILPTETAETLPLCPGTMVQVFDSIFSSEGKWCRTFSNLLGCDSTHCVTVSKAPAVTLKDPPADTLMVKIGKTLAAPSGFANYLWLPPTDGLSCTDCPNPTLTLPDTGRFVYKLLVKNAAGCSDTMTFRGIVFPPCDANRLGVPTAFTPNGDRHNDVFRVVPFEGLERVLELQIFNRWGEKIFVGTGGNAIWDGTQAGKLAPADTYIYKLQVACPFGGGQSTRHGEVSLMR